MLGLVTGWLAGVPGDPDAVRMVGAYTREIAGRKTWTAGGIDVSTVEAGRHILDAPPEQRARILATAFRKLCATQGGVSGLGKHSRFEALRRLSSQLLRARLPLSASELRRMVRATGRAYFLGWLPMAGLMRAVEQFAEDNPLDKPLVRALEALQRRARKSTYADTDKIAGRIEALLGGPEKKPALARGPFGRTVKEWLKGQDTPVRRKWQALVHHADALGSKSRPSARWMKEAAPLVADVGEDGFAGRMEDWLGALELDPAKPDPNADIIKALIFMAVHVGDERLAVFLGRFCETCYRKVPNFGARSMKLGNACLYALGQMGERGVAELVRVRGRMKYAQARQLLEKALTAAAERAGISVDELEEIALPDFGLGADGALREALGEVTAEIRIAGSEEVALNWFGADGQPRKTVPASVKNDHADALKAQRARVKEIKGLLAGQRYRLESLYLKDRTWPLAVWRERYLEHPLMANLSRRLIWTVGGTAVVPHGDSLIGMDGGAVDGAGEGGEVSLWHPLDADANTVLGWRRRLAALEITQPFKQAHREIYVLTDAERETATYSNRFASHILRQHQFSALCQARGWRYTLQGNWDSHNIPERRIEDRNLNILFAVDPAGHEALTDMGIFQYVATDRVIFGDGADGTLNVADVPPRLFSELMRDVDLFVGVSSIGADPEWVDRGPDDLPPLLEYWHSYNTAALTETAKTRRAVLEDLLPKLKIADVCELEERHLKVRGKRRTYKIHLGSGNILMEPNARYLCIVPGSGKNVGGDRVVLPFEGDGLLSIILSKAFLLAEDDKITDPTILGQIGM